MAGLRPAHVELEVASLVAGLGFDAPHILTLTFDRWALAVEAVALSVVAFHQIFDVEIGRAVS